MKNQRKLWKIQRTQVTKRFYNFIKIMMTKKSNMKFTMIKKGLKKLSKISKKTSLKM